MARRILKIFTLILCVTLILASLSALAYLHSVQTSADYVKFDKSRLTEVCTGLTILDGNGEEIKEALSVNNRSQIPLTALHDYTYKAFVAVEDKRFFEHNGLDGKRILGAVWHNINSKSYKEGASTITQQLIKNTHLDNKKSMKRKVNEMLLALELEKNYTKEEILEMYLNTIYFGRNAYGVENAANVYFGKSAADLTIAESATLAGMIKAPNNYAPDKNVEKCKKRRDLVLKLMLEQKAISQEQHDEAVASQIEYKPFCAVTENGYISQVIDEACRVLNMSATQLFHSELIIETYYDANAQKAVDKYAAKNETQNTDGSLADVACVICERDGGISACYFRGKSALKPKQIGSTAKPIAVYTPALCEGLITQASPVLDEPTNFGGYAPTNASGYCGWTTVKTAVTKSLNVPAVKTLNTLGLKTAQKYLEKLGFDGEQNLSLALGNINGGMTATELTNCYATLASGGINNGVGYVKCICGENGELYRRQPKNKRVFDENATFLMTDMLENAAKYGTAKLLKNAQIPVAAKTGTVGTENGNTEALVAGYTTEHTFVFWLSGTFDNKINGGTAPCEMAYRILKEMYAEQPKPFEQPGGIVKLAIDKTALYKEQQVVKATGGNDSETFLFVKDKLPKVKTENTKDSDDTNFENNGTLENGGNLENNDSDYKNDYNSKDDSTKDNKNTDESGEDKNNELPWWYFWVLPRFR